MYQIAIALIFNALDMVTGIIAGVKNKNIQSSKLRDGLFKKVGFIFCYLLAWLIDTNGDTVGISIGVSLLPIIVLYVVLTEITSIIENICKINTDIVPEKLKELFHLTGGETE